MKKTLFLAAAIGVPVTLITIFLSMWLAHSDHKWVLFVLTPGFIAGPLLPDNELLRDWEFWPLFTVVQLLYFAAIVTAVRWAVRKSR